MTARTVRWAGVGLLVAGTPVVRAQDQTATPTPPVATDSPATQPPQDVEFVGRDGQPLSAEQQREARERLRAAPLPLPKAGASSAQPDTPRAATTGDIVVQGRKPRGSVIGDIPAIQTFNPLDLKAYGANDIDELIQSLGQQVGSGRGRGDTGPVVLLNGKRVASFLDIAKIPTEAIERMEVFPEELALKYGYRADQKVVNVVTYQRFASTIGRLSDALSTDGGCDTQAIGGNYLRIVGNTRVNIDIDYNRSGALLERERGIRQPADTPDLGSFRTLLPSNDRLVLNGTASAAILDGVTSALNGRFETTSSRSLLGIGTDGAIARDIYTRVAHLGTTLDGRIGTWTWSLTANYDRSTTATLTDSAVAGTVRDTARAVNALADATLVLTGAMAKLPAGPLSATVQAGGATRDFAARSVRAGIVQPTALSRDRGSVQLNADLPLANRALKVAPWLGDLSANVNLAAERLSDRGTLWTYGYGVNWSPIGRVNIIASATNEEAAPTVEQLGAPLVVTPNVRTFDLVRQEAVDVTRVFGGNPDLRADSRHVIKLGINAKPIAGRDLTLSVDYIRTRIDDPIAAFPIATPAIEATFPERFARDSNGRLMRIDGRPLNYARSAQEQWRWGLNVVRPLGPVPESMRNAKAVFVGNANDVQRSLPPGARVLTPEPGSAAARQFENLASRLILSAYYTLTTVDRISPRDGAPTLDLLDGFATGPRGGSSRHKVEVQASAFKKGLGVRATTTWQSNSFVRGAGGGTGDLRFADYAIVNLNLFANIADRLGGSAAPAIVKGARITFGITNLFNSRPRVRDNAGATPLAYQPAYLDPLGRSVNISLRKLF